jgi:hypothetical protein
MESPKRPYEMILKIGADSLEDLINSFNYIEFDIIKIQQDGFNNKQITSSGGPGGGYNFELIRTETANHEEYFEKLNKYLEEIR